MLIRRPAAHRAFLFFLTIALFVAGLLPRSTVWAADVCAVEGDLDHDCDVDVDDLIRLSRLWMAQAGSPDWQWNGFAGISQERRGDIGNAGQNRGLAGDVNEPVVTDVTLTPAGGFFELPGGLVIDVPPGAVSEDTSFQIRLLQAGEVEPYLDIGATKKGFMGGFEMISEGIVFDVPIWVRFPIVPLQDPNSLPHVFYLDKEKGSLTPDLPQRDDVVSPPRGSSSILGATAANSGVMYDPRNAIAEYMLSITPPENQWQMLIELYDVLGHSDCVDNPCRCLRQFVTSLAADFAEGDLCSKVTEEGSIQFPDCEGQPIEPWQMEYESIQIAYKMSPDRRSILCDESLTMTVDVFDIDGKPRPGHEVTVTSSRPDLLAVTSFLGNVFLLERVGEDTGIADVVIDAGCEVTRTVAIQIGCEVPNVAGRWSVGGSESWWGCLDPEDNGTYPYPAAMSIAFSQTGSNFQGSISFEEHGFDVIMYYTERYHGEIERDCEINDRCVFKVSGSTSYTEEYVFLEDEGGEPYIINGRDTFTGILEDGVMTLSTSGGDTSGDTCQSAGTIVLTR